MKQEPGLLYDQLDCRRDGTGNSGTCTGGAAGLLPINPPCFSGLSYLFTSARFVGFPEEKPAVYARIFWLYL
jgi:hypothetical protein